MFFLLFYNKIITILVLLNESLRLNKNALLLVNNI